MFGDAATNYYKTAQYIGNQTYVLDKYGSAAKTGNEISTFIDGVMSTDLFAIVLQNKGQRVVQIHRKDKSFTNLASVNSINQYDAET